MSNISLIENLIASNQIEEKLRTGSQAINEIRSLQIILHEIGFVNELNWQKFGADGNYGKSTKNAVAIFSNKNSINSDGSFVSEEIANQLVRLVELVDDLRYLKSLIDKNSVEENICKNSSDKIGIIALQTTLNDLGYGNDLGWDKYGADGIFGSSTSNALNAFCEKNNLPADKKYLSRQAASLIVENYSPLLGEHWNIGNEHKEVSIGNLKIQRVTENNKKRIYVSNGIEKVRFNEYKKGIFYVGKQKAVDFINSNKERLKKLNLTESAINVMISVSENEGNLDAINTWDNSFLTVGMFQWTIGADNNKGELPALLQKIKNKVPDTFNKYFGRLGLNVTETDDIYGYFTLNSMKLLSSLEKEKLRNIHWAYYFWLACQDDNVKAIQIEHALSRIKKFYRSDNYLIGKHHIAELATSEYSVGLILDNHVNRPGYIKPCLEKALQELQLGHPEFWTTDDEREFINKYLNIRETYGKYPMTDAAHRAEVTKKYLTNGTISDERNTFII
ncbi:MAG: peptidoglycan-binding protein [Rhodothermaceae bacterium]